MDGRRLTPATTAVNRFMRMKRYYYFAVAGKVSGTA